MKETPTGRRSDVPITGSDEEARHNHGIRDMVTPLGKESSDCPVPPAPLRYSAVWDWPEGRIADARHAVRTLLARAGHHPDHRPSQDAQLVVSELVTNAVRHAPGPGALLLITRLCDRLYTVGPGTGKQVVAHLPLHRSEN